MNKIIKKNLIKQAKKAMAEKSFWTKERQWIDILLFVSFILFMTGISLSILIPAFK